MTTTSPELVSPRGEIAVSTIAVRTTRRSAVAGAIAANTTAPPAAGTHGRIAAGAVFPIPTRSTTTPMCQSSITAH